MKRICIFLCLIFLSSVAHAEHEDMRPNWDSWRWHIDSALEWCTKEVPKDVKKIWDSMGVEGPSATHCAFWSDYSKFFDQFLKKLESSKSYFQSAWYFRIIEGEPNENVYDPDSGASGYSGFDLGTLGLFDGISECMKWQQKALQADFYVSKCISNRDVPIKTGRWWREEMWWLKGLGQDSSKHGDNLIID